MKLTNYTNGPKTVNTKAGGVLIAAGATSEDIDVSDDELAAMEAVNFLGTEGMDQQPRGAFPTTPESKTLGLGDAALQPLGTDAGGNEVQALVDGNSKAQLLDIAEGEGVEGVTADNNKEEIATKIVETRNAE